MLKKNTSYRLYKNLLCLLLIGLFPFSSLLSQERADSLSIANDSIESDSIQDFDPNTDISKTKKVMKDDVVYSAKDSIIMLADGTIVMYNESQVEYGKINLEAYYIRLNQDSNTIYAEGMIDTNGVLVQTPVFQDGGETFDAETIKYNFATGKGLIHNLSSEQADGYVNGGVTKRMDPENLCMRNGRYTTCSNKDHPHFYLKMTKAKVKPGKSIVTGPAYLVVEDIPLPLAIPFGFFPFTESYSSGFIMPTYGEENTRGFYLRDGGYYFALSDYMDLGITGDIYTLGSWALYGKSNYKVRYKFSGNFGANYRVNVTGDKDKGTETRKKDFSVNWTHRQDAKASAYSSFSASVNFTSSSYENNDLERVYDTQKGRNHKSSSIAFSQRFPEAPFNLSLSANASQNAADSSVTVSLPQMAISMNRIYPFKRKKGIGSERWYEKVGVSYSGSFSNSFSGDQAGLFESDLIKDWRNGFQHSIPVSTSFQLFNKLTISPSISYKERWYSSNIEQSWDDIDSVVVADTTWGFNRVYDYSTSVSMSTKLYGMYYPIRAIFGDKVQAIRHVMTPSVSMSWRPDFGQEHFGYYDTYYDKSDSIWEEVTYSKYQGSLYGTPGSGKSGVVGMSLGNNLEMKVRDDRDSTNDFKKIKLINRLNLSTGYNIMADSLNWSNISASLGLTIFKKSVNISAAFDPYSYDETGRKINTFYFNDYGKIMRLTRASTSMGLSIDEKKVRDFFSQFGEGNDEDEDDKKSKSNKYDENGYLKFSLPWSVNFSYSISYNSVWDTELEDYTYEGNSNLSMSGRISLTEKWGASFNSGYNFRTHEMASTRFSITRNLHCWSMSASFVPIGDYKSYNFAIRVNSAMLSDLKYDRRSSPYDTRLWD